MIYATAPEELAELADLCRAGKLFEVQKWVKEGRPVALAKETKGKGTTRNPLRIAMNRGFYSLVQVLLEAGAPWRAGNYDALDDAVSMRRPDLASLLIQHGAQVAEVSMSFVLEMWHPEMVELFISNGASLCRGNPVACALIYKMRPTLGLLKRFSDNPAIVRQGGMALRYHANGGNTKWVSLLLWAGADPWARGPYRPEDLDDDVGEDEEYLSAIELAVMGGKLDVLRLKKLITVPVADNSATAKLIEYACHAPDSAVLSWLFERGHRPEAIADCGTAAISLLLNWMSWDFPSVHDTPWSQPQFSGGIDSFRALERMKMLHMLVAHGAKWLPADKHMIADARRNLLKMAPAYALEFAWLMQTYRAARRKDMEELFRTPAMARLLARDRDRLSQIVAGIPEEPLGGERTSIEKGAR